MSSRIVVIKDVSVELHNDVVAEQVVISSLGEMIMYYEDFECLAAELKDQLLLLDYKVVTV